MNHPKVLSGPASLPITYPPEAGGEQAPSLPAKVAFPNGAGGREEPRASICFLLNASCLQNSLGTVQAPQIRNTWERRRLSRDERLCYSLGKLGGSLKGFPHPAVCTQV